jgi:hypothetical protein
MKKAKNSVSPIKKFQQTHFTKQNSPIKHSAIALNATPSQEDHYHSRKNTQQIIVSNVAASPAVLSYQSQRKQSLQMLATTNAAKHH